MDLTKVYYDDVGQPLNILQAVKSCPEWAANRIQVGERALAMLPDAQRRAAEKGESPATVRAVAPANKQSTPCSAKCDLYDPEHCDDIAEDHYGCFE